MSIEDNGGPAFPMPFKHGELDHECEGMTLRDYFAAKAMQGFSASHEYYTWSFHKLAQAAYEQADAMLEARKQ